MFTFCFKKDGCCVSAYGLVGDFGLLTLITAMAGRGVNFKDEEEVKEYLENLGTEYRFGCYHEKNPKCESDGNISYVRAPVRTKCNDNLDSAF